MMKKNKLAVVVPCYNEEVVLSETTKRLSALFDALIAEQKIAADSFILYVDDGSKDGTWALIEQLHKTLPYVCGLHLAVNAGHQNALMAGLSVAVSSSDMMVTIDADLQDDVCAIRDMVAAYDEGNDIVYGVRRSRQTDSRFKRYTALFFYKTMSFLGVNAVYNHADFRLMSRRAVDFLLQFRERNLFLRGIVPLLGYRSTKVYYDRAKRFDGESKYPLSKMLNFAIDGITSFSVEPVRMIFALGLIFVLVSIIIFIYVLTSYFLHDSVAGWSSLMLSIWFCSGCVLMGLGIIGEYIGKIYIEVKDRPRYHIEEVLMKDETV